jgi:multiple antibiotic resistance protein
MLLQFAHELFSVFVIVFATLFPVINPLGGAPIFLNLTQDCSVEVRKKLASSISINSFVMLIVAMLVGPQLLLFFGNFIYCCNFYFQGCHGPHYIYILYILMN